MKKEAQRIGISKKTFVNTLNAIQKEHEKSSRFNDALNNICDGYPVCELGNGYLNALIDVLNELFMEQDEYYPTIDWWLFEDVEKVIYIAPANDESLRVAIDVSTPETLYDFLINQVTKKIKNEKGDDNCV